MNSAITKLLVALVATALTVAALECTLRWLGFKPAVVAGNEHFSPESKYGWAALDSGTGWRNKPGVAISMEPGNVPMTFWDDGRRATRSYSTISALPQILILGCSMTQGYGVTDGETFAYRLAALAPGWDVENFGTGGYGAYQSLLTLRQLFASPERKYAPKLVVYGYANFHAYRDVAAHGWVIAFRNFKGEFFAPPHVVPKSGGLKERSLRIFPLFPLETESALVASIKNTYLRLLFLNRERYEEEVTRALLIEMKELAARNGARLLVLGLTNPTPAVEALAQSGAIEFANCPAFDPALNLADKSFLVGGIGHPNGKAHESWARCLAHWMDSTSRRSFPRQSFVWPAHCCSSRTTRGNCSVVTCSLKTCRHSATISPRGSLL